MNIGNWENSIHESEEQLNRLESAKKAETTPSYVDDKNQTATFKGSGKEPYITTLDSCTCADFVRRKLPCKHIYRLSLELGLIQEKFVSGKNKNELTHDIFSLPVETQEILYDLCDSFIYAKETIFVLPRNEFSELLLLKGFCVESIISVDVLQSLSVRTIKDMLFKCNFENCPLKKSSQKKTVIAWVTQNSDNVISTLASKFILLEFTEETAKLAHTIKRRYYKKFKVEMVEVVPNSEMYSERVTKIFTQE